MLGLSILLAASFVLTGCFEIQGVHVLHSYGESDTGWYRIKMSRAMMDNGRYGKMLKDLRTWSRPATRSDDDNYYVEDVTGTASMEHFYQTYKCETSPQPGYADCHFAFSLPGDVGDLPGWSINWDVVLQPNMKVLTSNHQRAAREDGRDHLIWCFDGNKTSSANVDFTVRVLKIR